MARDPLSVYPLASRQVIRAGEPVVAATGPLLGVVIQNPRYAADQNLVDAEVLLLDVVGLAGTVESITTIPLQPGQTWSVLFPGGQTTSVSINAASAGHRFAGYILQAAPVYPPTPQPGTFPPSGPVTLAQVIPSYLYQQYADDDDLQAFVAAYNTLAQEFVDWFTEVPLAAYSSDLITGSLLDWVADGLYGFRRPALSSGRNRDVGPYNTWAFNSLAYNRRRLVGPTDVTVTTDDIFKRIITWNFYKGDGNIFNLRWLKRRVMRFLLGEDGAAPNVEQTYNVSVTYGDGVINIRLSVGSRSIDGGAIYNRFGYNAMAYNRLLTTFHSGPDPLPFEDIFKEAMDAGVLTLPFQYTFVVTTSGG